MFEKIIGKRKKEADFFHISDKKYTTDQKIIAKMSTGALKDLFNDQEKYLGQLIEKVCKALSSLNTQKLSTIDWRIRLTSCKRKTRSWIIKLLEWLTSMSSSQSNLIICRQVSRCLAIKMILSSRKSLLSSMNKKSIAISWKI